MTARLEPATVADLATKHGIDVVEPEIRHSHGGWSVLLRLRTKEARYYVVRPDLRTRSLWVKKHGASFAIWCLDERSLDKVLSTLASDAEKAEAAE